MGSGAWSSSTFVPPLLCTDQRPCPRAALAGTDGRSPADTLFPPFLSCFAARPGLVTLRQTFVRRCPRVRRSSQDVLRGRWIAGALQPRLAVVPAPACAVPATRASRGAPRGGELQREPITTGLWNMGPQHKRVYARLRRAMRRDDRTRACIRLPHPSCRAALPPKPLVLPREPAGGDAHDLLRIGDGGADHLRRAAVRFEDGERALGAARLDHIAEAYAHVEHLEHLAVVDLGVALDERENRVRLNEPVDLVADGGGD